MSNGAMMASASRLASVPVELRALPQWVVWRLKPSPKDPAKLTKVPYQARRPQANGSSTDPSTWATFADAVKALETDKTLDGVGVVMTERCGLVGVDLDHCLTDRGALETWARPIVESLNSYTEVTPSGRGLRIFCEGHLPSGRRKNGDVEAYVSGRFLTVTGNHWPDAPLTVESRTSQLAAFHARYLADVPTVATEKTTNGNGNGSHPPDDAAILTRARQGRNGDRFRLLYDHGDITGHPSHSEADLALCSLLASAGADTKAIDRLFRGSRLYRVKWDEKHGAHTYGEGTIAKAASTANPTVANARMLPVLTVADLAELPPAQPVVDGLLFADTFAVIVGAYGSFKSFLALLLAVCIALGRECLGRATRKGPAVYVFGEGAHGIQSRVAALMSFLGVTDVPGLYFIPEAVLINTPTGLSALKQAIDNLPEKPVAIFLDTVARTLHGSDSDTADMSGYIEAADAIRRHANGALVVAIHHFGWEEKRSRGSTVLPASADSEFHLFRDGNRVTVRNPKQKDAPEAPDFTLEAVEFAGSLVLKPVGHDDSRLSESEKKCLMAVQQADLETGTSVAAIAKAKIVPRSTAYLALGRLERLAYVRCVKHRYFITEAGKMKLREGV